MCLQQSPTTWHGSSMSRCNDGSKHELPIRPSTFIIHVGKSFRFLPSFRSDRQLLPTACSLKPHNHPVMLYREREEYQELTAHFQWITLPTDTVNLCAACRPFLPAAVLNKTAKHSSLCYLPIEAATITNICVASSSARGRVVTPLS